MVAMIAIARWASIMLPLDERSGRQTVVAGVGVIRQHVVPRARRR